MKNPNNKRYKCKIVQDSMEAHETSHLNEFRTKAPSICVGTKGRYTLKYSTWGEWRDTEMTAFNAQLDFLAKSKRNVCLSPECEAEINEWINFILNQAIPGVITGTYGR